MTVLITGANGNIASMAIQQLRLQNVPVRALIRDPDHRPELEAQGCEVVIHDLDEPIPSSVFTGIERALFITAPNANAAKQMHHLISAAIGTGVHVVRVSAIKAAADAPTENGRLHHESDQELMDSGLPYTILRPNWFMQNCLWNVDTILNENKIYHGMGEARIGMIDVRDVADCCVKILRDGGFEGEVLTLTGPEIIDWHRFAHFVGNAIDSDVDSVAVPVDAVRQGVIDMGAGEWMGDMLADYSTAYAHQWGAVVTDDVERVTGRPARGAKSFAYEVVGAMATTA